MLSGVAERLRPALDQVEVVPMRRRHLPQVLAIEAQVYPRPWSASLFAGELARRESRRYLVALAPAAKGARWASLWRRRRVVGYAGVIVQAGEDAPDAHITTVAVHPAEHRRKIATRLVAVLLRAAIDLGAGAATLEVRNVNRGAQRLYSSFGFAPAGVRPRYYAETGEDALVMWLYDLASPAVRARVDAQEARAVEPGGSSGAVDHHVPWVTGRVGLGDAHPGLDTEEHGRGPAAGDDEHGGVVR